MKAPLFVRPLGCSERGQLRAGLRSPDAFTLRRCQILLASASGQTPRQVAAALGCSAGSVRNAIHAFHGEGLRCLKPKSSRPLSARPFLDGRYAEPLRHLLHQSPRLFGRPSSWWTLGAVAQVCHTRGWTPRQLSGESIRLALKRLGIRWKRAKHWITSPDPAYARKKHSRDRLARLAEAHPDWVLGFADEVWWSRLARPQLHAWAGEEPLHLEQLRARRDDPEPKALSCYGLWRADLRRMLLRFVDGRPVSQVTEDFLAWVCGELAREGKKALLLVWDNASWHVSQRVRAWIRRHNRTAKRDGGVRIVVCQLPVKAPWLNPIEARWVHGKRAILEPDRALTGQEVKERVCQHYGCEQREPLTQQVQPKRKRTVKQQVA
jgi:transposase